jgi:urocanate hydratase
VIRHADAGYEAAIETAEACDVAVPRRDREP